MVEEAAVDDGAVGGQMATTNCDGSIEARLELDDDDDAEPVPSPGDDPRKRHQRALQLQRV